MRAKLILIATIATIGSFLVTHVPTGAADAPAGSLKGTAKFEGTALKPTKD